MSKEPTSIILEITYINGILKGLEQVEYLLTMPQLNEVKAMVKELKGERKQLQELLKK